MAQRGTPRAQGRNKRKRTSQFRGVSKVGAKWKATITSNGAKHELGRFDTELQAAQCAARPPQGRVRCSRVVSAYFDPARLCRCSTLHAFSACLPSALAATGLQLVRPPVGVLSCRLRVRP